jgi:nucleoside-diphosphate-sugar epimerase
MSDSHLPKKIAILGATSQIAKDLVLSFLRKDDHDLVLFARRPEAVAQWIAAEKLAGRCAVGGFQTFNENEHFDAIINFVGSGNPAQTQAMGASILDVTQEYDTLALNYLRRHPQCRYLFLSSGAAYGSSFDEPVNENSAAKIEINHLQSQDWYAVAKLYAECRHRSLAHLPIVDIRVFNYFSHTLDMAARFFITDILRAIRSGETLIVSSDNIVRDYIGPADFYQLVSGILSTAPSNEVVDCYTNAPVDKMTLLAGMQERFGLRYEVRDAPAEINATGTKKKYFSKNRKAERFGYLPPNNSLENVIREAGLALDRYSKNGVVN